MRLLVDWRRVPGPSVQAVARALEAAPSITWASLDEDRRDAQMEGPRLVLDVDGDAEITDSDVWRITLRDVAGVPLHRSDQLHRPVNELLEVVVGVFPPHAPGSFAPGYIRGTGDPTETLQGAVNVLPLLIRKAQASPSSDTRTPPETSSTISDAPKPLNRPTTRHGFAARLSAAVDNRFRRTHWQVGVVKTRGSVTDALVDERRLEVHWLEPPRGGRYWADPCLTFDSDGALWVFVEEFPLRDGNGRIVALRYTPTGVTDVRTVLADDHHRALPRVQRHGDRWLATVDTCQTPAPVFTFDEPGQPWRPIPGAFLPPFAVDPILSRSGDVWSVMLTNWTLDEGSACETWRSEGGPPFDWHRDDTRGYVDPQRARGAGHLDTTQGLRAVQDCSAGYGLKTSLVSLAPGPDGRPELLATLLPEQLSGRGWENTHTLDWVRAESSQEAHAGCYVVLDAARSIVDVRWPFLRKRELQHLRACREASLAAAGPDLW